MKTLKTINKWIIRPLAHVIMAFSGFILIALVVGWFLPNGSFPEAKDPVWLAFSILVFLFSGSVAWLIFKKND